MLLASSDTINVQKKVLLNQMIENSEQWRPGESLSTYAEEICELSSEIIKGEWIRIKKRGPVHNVVSLAVILTGLIIFISLLKR